MTRQAQKADRLRELHAGPELLILPNVWDPIGARLLESLGYPAVATASAAVAWSLGVDDGQRLPFEAMRAAIERVASAVGVPVTADIERGYAEDLDGLAANVRAVIAAGAVGINIEDSFEEGGGLRDASAQAERIRVVREAAAGAGVPIVVNARIDVFLREGYQSQQERLAEAIGRARVYLEAGADCLYPIGLSSLDALRQFVEKTQAAVNVFATRGVPPPSELRAAGVRRLSLGPGMFKASLTAMKRVAVALRQDGSYGPFLDDAIGSDEVVGLVGP